ncbi:MAG TPA: hypothetical protein VIL28_02165 [Steroidobacteraceae bacterium]
MLNGYLNRFILGLAIAAGAAGCAGPQEKAAQVQSPARENQMTEADGLAAEALAAYHLQRDGARTLNLIAAATNRAPQRADLAYLQLALCRAIEGCQPEPYETIVRKLEPANAVVWMRVLEQAQQQRETSVEAHILEAMGRAETFNVHWNELVAAITGARIALGAGANAALSETVGWLGETIVPSLQPLTHACARTRTAEREWAQRCSKLAQVLANADTYVVEALGLKIAQQVTAEKLEQDRLAQRALTARYLWRESGTIIESQVERDKFALQLVELMRKLRREQDVQLAVVRWAGSPVVPPRGWTDE